MLEDRSASPQQPHPTKPDRTSQDHKAGSQSQQLLEMTKTRVERAIETDEATATTWMNQQLKALGVDLS